MSRLSRSPNSDPGDRGCGWPQRGPMQRWGNLRPPCHRHTGAAWEQRAAVNRPAPVRCLAGVSFSHPRGLCLEDACCSGSLPSRRRCGQPCVGAPSSNQAGHIAAGKAFTTVLTLPLHERDTEAPRTAVLLADHLHPSRASQSSVATGTHFLTDALKANAGRDVKVAGGLGSSDAPIG